MVEMLQEPDEMSVMLADARRWVNEIADRLKAAAASWEPQPCPSEWK